MNVSGSIPSVIKNWTGLMTRKIGLISKNILFDSGTIEYGYTIGILQYTTLKIRFKIWGTSRIYGVKNAKAMELLHTEITNGKTRIGTNNTFILNLSGYKIIKAIYIATNE